MWVNESQSPWVYVPVVARGMWLTDSSPIQPPTTMSCGSRSLCGMAWCWSPSASSTTWLSATTSFTCGPQSTRH